MSAFPPIRVREVDGNPSILQPTELIFPNASLSIVGRRVTISFAGGAGTVTTIGVTTANGVSAVSDADPTNPKLTFTLGAITPSSVSTGSLTSSALTAGRVPIVSTAGLLADDADMTFLTDTLAVTKVVVNTLATFPTPFTLGSTSVTATGTELNFVVGVTSSIQTQLNAKQSTISFGTGVQTALGVNVGTARALH